MNPADVVEHQPDATTRSSRAVVTLVTGSRSALRDAAIAAAIPIHGTTALLLEGMPDGNTALDAVGDRPEVSIARVAHGCVCCTGNLVMTVTLNRILRRTPQRIFISLASNAHVTQVRQFLQSAPYDALITLTDDLECA